MDSKENCTRSLQIDPLNMCQPIGAILALQGLHAALPHSHGASGCCRFQRDLIRRHSQKLIRATSSMLREEAAVFGGESNLKTGLQNAFSAYDPAVVGVMTTCLSETIGDDLSGIMTEVEAPKGKHLVWATTPGYTGSHITGYANMTAAILSQLPSGPRAKENRAFLVPGLLNPADIREIKRIASFFGPCDLCPDNSDVMAVLTPEKVTDYAPGGTPVETVVGAGACKAVLSLGREGAGPGGRALAQKGGMPHTELDLPIGLAATDRFVAALSGCFGVPVPEELLAQRKRFVDRLMAVYPLVFGKTFSIFSDPDISLPLTEFLAGIGLVPKHVVTGWAGPGFAPAVQAALETYGQSCRVDAAADLYTLEEWFLQDGKPDLLVGFSHGKLLAHRENIPLVRVGFPVTDRPLQDTIPITGYAGAAHLLARLLEVLQEQEDQNCGPDGPVFYSME